MRMEITTHLSYRLTRPMDLLMQIEVAELPGQRVLSRDLALPDGALLARSAAEAGLGERMWIRTEDLFVCDYRVEVEVTRPAPDIATLGAFDPFDLTGDTLRYLMPSRYVPSDECQPLVEHQFGHLAGGARIAAIADWIRREFTYEAGASDAQTTALHTLDARRGVCRDFAHVLIALARASAIPARYASVYAPGVVPQDFHAVAEVFLEGAWRLIDPTGMAQPGQMALIGAGMDAAEVSFLMSYGWIDLRAQSVDVRVTAQ